MNLKQQILLSVTLVAALIAAGCNTHRTISQEKFANLGHFDFRKAAQRWKGIVVGAPHGAASRGSDRLAMAISDRTGAGLVVGYGFRGKWLSVNQPVVSSHFSSQSVAEPLKRKTVYRSYATLVQSAAVDQVKFYIGIHSAPPEVSNAIEVVCNGLSFEQARAIKASYRRIRDKMIGGGSLPRLEMLVDPVDEVSWRTYGVKHHGVLLHAEKGILLRQPYLSDNSEELYSEILSQWAEDVLDIALFPPEEMPSIKVELSRFGRLELITSRRNIKGVVLGAPHGTFDEYTARLAQQLSFTTGLSTVIATGFTPVEANGWRINVNRPTEKMFPSEGLELHSSRAREAYAQFKGLVSEASGGDLKFYIDLHQYGGTTMQVATVGVSRDEAKIVRSVYDKVSNQVLRRSPELTKVPFLIEPLDGIEIAAWPAKADGILRVAKRSLHIEIPQRVLANAESRKAYTEILLGVVQQSLPVFGLIPPAS